MVEIIKYFGPPGVGKTTKLRELVLEEVAAGTPLAKMAYLSFTAGAADVIRERVKATDEDLKWFRTIHAACLATLGIGRESVMQAADYRLLRIECGIDVRSDEFDDWNEDKPIDFTPTKRAHELALATGRDIYDIIREMPQHANLTGERVAMFQDLYGSFKRNHHKFDFTDMLTGYLAEPVPLPVDVIFLDEAQDLSYLQWAVFHQLAKNAKRIYMAGDDDQAIYGFIGGSEYGFLDHPADQEHVISKSWRVPMGVGMAADKVIAKVSHRKQKNVQWMDKPGEFTRMNLDAFTLPWRDLLEQNKDIMVLTRHRKGARNFSDDLKAVGIPHDLNGEGLKSWKEAKIAETFLKLRDGGKVTVRQALNLMHELEIEPSMLKGLKPRQMVTKELLPLVPFKESFVELFGGHDQKRVKRYEAIRQLVNQDGVDALGKEPSVRVSTMHAAKGAEADLVIIVPECTSIVRRNILTPSEIRLAYVAMTRVKKQGIILIPRSDNYITHFFGG